MPDSPITGLEALYFRRGLAKVEARISRRLFFRRGELDDFSALIRGNPFGRLFESVWYVILNEFCHCNYPFPQPRLRWTESHSLISTDPASDRVNGAFFVSLKFSSIVPSAKYWTYKQRAEMRRGC